MRRLAIVVPVVVLLAAANAHAGTIRVPAGGDLQQAINQAQPGDTILLAAGATFAGNFVLPAKNGTSYITIRSDAADSSLPAAGQRISPAYASYLPKLQSPSVSSGGTPALATQPYASYYILQFIEFLPNPSGTGAMLALGSAESTQNSLDVVPHDIIVDRCYLHSYPGVAQLRGIALNSAKTTIENSYISEIKAAGSDSQAIAGWNGPGPFTIVNNYLEAAGENVLIGGSSMFIPNCTPSNIEFRNNYVGKDPNWRGSSWVVKNLFELKHAQDVTVDGNVFEYNWPAGQDGYSILFTPRNQYGDNLWTVVQRVAFTNNIVRHVSSAFNILGWDNEHPSQQTNHLTFRNNVLEDVSAASWGGDGRIMLISETPDVTVDHNTAFNSGSAVYAYNTASHRFVFTNNIVNAALYGICGASAGGSANTAISMYFADGTFLDNLLVGAPPSTYPAGNYFPSSFGAVGFVNQSGGDYHLSSSSPYKGQATDGTDPGANIDALNAAQASSATPPASSDYAPAVSLTSPAAGASFPAGSTISIAANASDADSTPVARVDFYANGSLVGSDTAPPYAFSWSSAAAGSYSLTAIATDTGGLKATSAAVTITVTSGTTTPSGGVLPSPWIDADVGSVGLGGSASYSNGVFTVKGAGADIWGQADSFNYVYQALTGDGQIVARVASLQNTNAYAKAGVAIRETLNAGSIEVTLDVKPGGGIEFLRRTSTNGSTTCTGSSGAAPVWLKLVRSGTTIAGYTSADGSTWSSAGSTTVSTATNVYVGLAVTSHNTAVLNTATFDNVTVGAATAAPGPSSAGTLTDQDIGAVGIAGSASVGSGVYTVKGAGADIWGAADSFNFAYQALSGDGQIVARVTSLQNTNSYAKAGVMIRETLAAGSRSVLVDVKPGGGVELLARTSSGGSTAYLAGGTGSAPIWLKLVRSGATISAYSSADGSAWVIVGSASVTMTTSVYVGLVVCSHNTGALNTATFDQLAISGSSSATTAPFPYTDADIGSVGIAGSAGYGNLVYTVKGAGADIWGAADSFNFAYAPLSGNGQIVARVTSVQNTNTYAKAGVMIRETTAGNSASVLLDVKPGGGLELLARSAAGASTTYVAGTSGAAPVWVKLVRAGTTITGYTSADGATWTAIGNVSVSMATNVYVGLAVCSHNTNTLNTATFDNVSR